MFESLVLFGLGNGSRLLVIRIRLRVPVLGAAVALMAAVTLAYASSFGSDIEPLVPALRSNWLTFHVFSCFLGYSGFAISFIASIAYLVITRRAGPPATPDVALRAGALPEQLGVMMERGIARTVAFGFIFPDHRCHHGGRLGATRPGAPIGRGTRRKPGRSSPGSSMPRSCIAGTYADGPGRRAAWISIIGFLSVLFTYVGVNLLLSGLHSYA